MALRPESWHPTGVRRFAIVAATAAAVLAAAAPAGAAKGPAIPQPELRQIRALLREFVPAAVARDHPGRAWALAAPSMREGTTLAQWRQGDLPVFPYPAVGRGFGILPVTVEPDDVTFELMVRPKPGTNAGMQVFSTEVQRIAGQWRVASMTTRAEFAPPGDPARVTAAPDFGVGAGGQSPTHQNLSENWLLIPLVVLGLPLLVALGALLVSWRRSRGPGVDVDAHKRATTPWI
jgi:hypothetical protein